MEGQYDWSTRWFVCTVPFSVCPKAHSCPVLTLFDMGFFLRVSYGGGGGGHEGPHHNFVVIAPMIMKFGTGVQLDLFYTMVTKNS